MEMRCCGGGWGWVLLLQLKLMPLKSQPSTATPGQHWDKDSSEDRDVWARQAQGQLGQQERALARCCSLASLP